MFRNLLLFGFLVTFLSGFSSNAHGQGALIPDFSITGTTEVTDVTTGMYESDNVYTDTGDELYVNALVEVSPGATEVFVYEVFVSWGGASVSLGSGRTDDATFIALGGFNVGETKLANMANASMTCTITVVYAGVDTGNTGSISQPFQFYKVGTLPPPMP